MRLVLRNAIAAGVLSVVACAQPHAETAKAATNSTVPASPAAHAWLSDVRAIVHADAGEGRRRAIQKRLDRLGIQWSDHAFQVEEHRGTNLLADIGGRADAPLLLLGAHADQVSKGEGATDNASGSATVLALAQRLKERPLAHHRVAIAFWDLEEKGLLGARAYVANGGPKPALYVNFDVFGWGDTVWMMTPQPDGALARSSATATAAHGLELSTGEHYPPTDHLPFLKAGWPAVSYSLVGGTEIPLILDAYAGKKLDTVPKVMQVIHTDADTLEHIDAAAAARAIDAIEMALRRWDEGAAQVAASR